MDQIDRLSSELEQYCLPISELERKSSSATTIGDWSTAQGVSESKTATIVGSGSDVSEFKTEISDWSKAELDQSAQYCTVPRRMKYRDRKPPVARPTTLPVLKERSPLVASEGSVLVSVLYRQSMA